MDNIVALFVVLLVVAVLMVLAAIWFYVLLALCALWGLLELSGFIYRKTHKEV